MRAWFLSVGIVSGLAFAACGNAGGGATSAGTDDDGGSPSTDDGGGSGDAASPSDSGMSPADGGTPIDPPTIKVGAKDRFLLLGTVITPDTIIEGAVLVEQSTITCVDTASICAGMPNAPGATVIDTKGVIAPGLVDTHNHILFDIFNDDDWMPAQKYQNHDQWPNEPKYQAMLKQYLAGTRAAMLATGMEHGMEASYVRMESIL